MQQHPLPQNITTYQFRLVGDMTLKQFLELVIGVGTAILFYKTNLVLPIKFFLVLFSAIFGFALAFMPLEERPLDQWLIAFFKAIYRPTHLIWKKSSQPLPFMEYVNNNSTKPSDEQDIMEAIIKRKRDGLSSFLQTLPPDHLLNQMETFEQNRLHRIDQIFNNPLTDTRPATAQPLTSLNISPTTAPAATSIPSPLNPLAVPTPPPSTRRISPTPPPSRNIVIEKQVRSNQQAATLSNIYQSSAPQPLTATVAIQHHHTTVSATTSHQLPFPSTPSTPNTIVGMVLTSDGKIIDNAIVEIRDSNQIPVRATKTNQLGQFFSSTPLKNGNYEVEAEKPEYVFDILSLKLDGNIVDPLKIQAKPVAPQTETSLIN